VAARTPPSADHRAGTRRRAPRHRGRSAVLPLLRPHLSQPARGDGGQPPTSDRAPPVRRGQPLSHAEHDERCTSRAIATGSSTSTPSSPTKASTPATLPSTSSSGRTPRKVSRTPTRTSSPRSTGGCTPTATNPSTVSPAERWPIPASGVGPLAAQPNTAHSRAAADRRPVRLCVQHGNGRRRALLQSSTPFDPELRAPSHKAYVGVECVARATAVWPRRTWTFSSAAVAPARSRSERRRQPCAYRCNGRRITCLSKARMRAGQKSAV
jgi:hypothetical protein